METSIDKMRVIVSWADYQNEGFNQRFKSISDIEKAYDYCVESDLVEFLDKQSLFTLTELEEEKVVKEVTELLGYSIF